MSEQKQEKNKTEALTENASQNHKIFEGMGENKVQQEISKEQDEEQIPEHFYDSDIASVNEKDFQSDNEPPKDIVYERKLLHKEKLLHIFKTIVKVGKGIDKPAPYDEITLKFKEEEVSKEQKQFKAKEPTFLDETTFETFNLGIKYEEIERLVTSMKKGEAALFELEELEVSKKSNIKILHSKRVFQIQVADWITVIDLDSDLKFLKYVRQRGEGPHRVAKFDQVSYSVEITLNDKQAYFEEFKQQRIEEQQIQGMHPIIWKMLSSMKKKEIAEMKIRDMHFKEQYQNIQRLQEYDGLVKKVMMEQQNVKIWRVKVDVQDIGKVDDFYLDGSILKKTLIRGVSTAKPDPSSYMYYALKFLGPNKTVLHQDQCFNSDWWEDYGKLEKIGCRKVFLDEYKISKFLKASMKRMKPAEVAEIQCRDLSLFAYGSDYEELKSLWPKEEQFPPKKIFIVVRVYNFTQGLTCFNMELEQKIAESRRRKPIAVSLLSKGNIKKAYKRFQNIVALFSSGNVNQAAYDEKVSALMNSILCLMKENKFVEMIPLCDLVLEQPKHGFDQEKMKLNGPQGLKVEGKIENGEKQDDYRIASDLVQNLTLIEKCRYRKALALLRTGESKLCLQTLSSITNKTDEVLKLEKEAEKHFEGYQAKSKKIFKNMFS